MLLGPWKQFDLRAWVGRLKGHGTLLRYSGASVLLQGVTMICNFLVLRWMQPEAVGLFQSVMLIQTYSLLVQAGTLNGLNRELPFALGAGRHDEMLVLAGTARIIALVGSGLLLVGIPVSLLFTKDTAVRFCVIAVLVSSASGIYRNYLSVTYRAERAFELLARLILVEAGLALASLPAVYWLGLKGLAGRFVFLSLAGMALNHWLRPVRNPGRFSWKALRVLMLTGVPLFAFGYLANIAHTFPRVILLSEAGVVMVGLFAPATAVIGALSLIPASIASYIYPQMSYRFGRTGDSADLWPMALAASVGTLVVSVPIVVAAWWFAPALITFFFPAYSEAAGAVRWTVVAGAFMGASLAVNALNSLKAWGWLAVYTGALFVLSYLFPWVGFRQTGTLEGLAAGMAASEVSIFLIGMWTIWSATCGRSRSTLTTLPAGGGLGQGPST